MRGAALLLALVWTAAASAAPLPPAQFEISFLLGYVEGSGCTFYRNGTAYDSKAAQAHLRAKYQYLATRNLIATTEDFIEKAATTSSFTGQPYG